MNRLLKEQLERIHRLNYGNNVIKSGFVSKILNEEVKKVDDPKKADLVTDNVKNFFDTLQKAADQGGISQQERGSMTFQKEVESMQIGLILLGYELPRYGVDGLFGPETGAAVKKFMDEHLGDKKPMNESVKLVSQGGGLIGRPGQGTHSASDWASGNAWDVSAPEGSEVYSLTSGIVEKLKKDRSGGIIKSGVKKIYGDQISIKSTDGGPNVFYTHIASQLNVGDSINKGDVVGTIMLVKGMPTHVHVGLSSGNLSDLALGLENAKGSSTTMTKATPEMLNKLINLLKEKGVNPEELKKLIDTSTKVGGVSISLSGDWVEITKQLLRKHEGFSETAEWDENAFRGGYGTDKKIVDGKLVRATNSTLWTKQEAEETMDYEIKNVYGPTVAKQLGLENWNKLNDKQKASLVSLGYNAGPYFLTARDYGRKIKSAIESGDMELASSYIGKGPTTGSSSGKHYGALARRRKEESDIFMS